MNKINIVDLEVYMHVDLGYSTAKIARLLEQKKNTVISNLRNRHVLRKAPGRATEELVAKWLKRMGKSVIRQRGDAPFDLLVNGKRIDVKSGNLVLNKKPSNFCYKFQLHDGVNAGKKVLADHIDSFYLVFLDLQGMPVYEIKPSEIKAKFSLSIPQSLKMKSKNLTLLGFLETYPKRILLQKAR